MRIARQPDLEVCGEAADITDAVRLVGETKPDVAIIDIALKTGNGIDLIKRIRDRNHSVRMLVWSMYGESLYGERALRAGAMGYINKEEATEKIIAAIRCLLEGKMYLSESLAQRLLTQAVGRNKEETFSPEECLSDRELEVFRLFGEGLNTKQIAERMFLSSKTVETYRTRIKEKLNLSSGNELIQRAVQWTMESGKS